METRPDGQPGKPEGRAADLEAPYPTNLGPASSFELGTVLNTILESAFALVPHLRNASVFLYHESQLTLEASRSSGRTQDDRLANPPPGDPVDTAARQGEILTVPDIQADPQFANSAPVQPGALASIPLKIGESALGAVTLLFDQPHLFGESELHHLQVLGAQAAVAIQNAQLFKQAQHELAERRKAEEALRQLNEELEATRRSLRNELASRHQREATLWQPEERFRRLFENVSDMIAIVNADATLRYASPSIERIIGYHPDELIGRRILDYLHPDDVRPALATWEEQAKTPSRSVVITVRCRHRDGTWRAVEVIGQNLLDDPVVAGVLITARDITERKRIEDELRHAEAQSRSILAAIPDLMFEVSPECVFVDYRAANPEDLIAPPEQFLGKHIREVLPLEFVDNATVAMGVAAATGETQILEYQMETRRGIQDFEARVTLTSSGRLLFIIRNITDRKQAEAALRESEERYMLAVRGANDGLWDWDLRSGHIYFSPRWKAILGYDEDELGDTPGEWFSRVLTDDLERVDVDIASHIGGITPFFASEHRLRHKDGTYRWVLARGLAVRDVGKKAHRIAGSLTDITDRKAAEEQLVHNALHDSLTDVPNRVYFIDQVRRLIERNRRRGDFSAAVMFIDLDGFKGVNDSLGHASGDKLLITIARRLESCLRPGDTVCRFGGDEFAVLLEDIRQVSDATHIAERIQNEVSKPVDLPGYNVITTASIGIAMLEKEYERPEDILRDADAAMYQAKTQGKARHVIFNRGSRTGRLTYADFEQPAAQ